MRENGVCCVSQISTGETMLRTEAGIYGTMVLLWLNRANATSMPDANGTPFVCPAPSEEGVGGGLGRRVDLTRLTYVDYDGIMVFHYHLLHGYNGHCQLGR